jgi:hypothetical protein
VIVSVDDTGAAPGGDPAPASADIGTHPRGTLAIVGVYGLLFIIGWLLFYFLLFLPRGPLTQ